VMVRPVRSAVLVALLAATVSSGRPAHAQPAQTDPLSASQADRNQAQAYFMRGYKLFVAKKYDQAMSEFRASLQIVASPNAHLYVARCLREKGELIDAYSEFQLTEAEAKALADRDERYAQTAQSATDERTDLEKSIALITFSVARAAPATIVKLGHEEIQPNAWSKIRALMPGPIDVVVQTPPDPPKRQTITLEAGDRRTIELEAVPLPPPAPPPIVVAPEPPPRTNKLRPYAYVAGGIGAAGLLTFAVAGAMSNATYSALENDCGDGPCPPSKADDISAGRTQQTIANVGLVIGLLGVAAGTTLFVLSAPEASRTSASVVAGPGWVGVRGAL
jgi:tetratricopeptide (TPR) repeat protein